jgi:hypothetical protein
VMKSAPNHQVNPPTPTREVTPRNLRSIGRQFGKAGELPKIEVTSVAPAIAADRGYY